MPQPSAIDQLYWDYYVEGQVAQTFQAPLRLAKHILALTIGNQPADPLRILEIGGGDGTLVKEIAKLRRTSGERSRIEAVEVELYSGSDIHTDELSLEFSRRVDQVDGRFNLVIANACLHQIPDLNGVLRPAFDRLDPGGWFFASTAYLLPVALLSRDRLDLQYPYHVHDLGAEFWTTLPESLGLSANVCRSAPSMVESQFSESPLRTIFAHLLKLPARLEGQLRSPGSVPAWKAVGGWEIVIQLRGR